MNVALRKTASFAVTTVLLLTLPPVPALARDPSPIVLRCTGAAEQGQVLRANSKLREAAKQLAICVAHECPVPVRKDCDKWLGRGFAFDDHCLANANFFFCNLYSRHTQNIGRSKADV